MIQKKVTKNLDPNKTNGHDMIDIREYLLYSQSCLISSNFTSDQKKTSSPYSKKVDKKKTNFIKWPTDIIIAHSQNFFCMITV